MTRKWMEKKPDYNPKAGKSVIISDVAQTKRRPEITRVEWWLKYSHIIKAFHE